MFKKPVKWRHAGIAALAGISLTLTALAAQVSPPNVQAADADKQNRGTKPADRVAIKLPTATLDRYVGNYKMNEQTVFDVSRDADRLIVKITGQPAFEVFAERENFFFWKIVDAQIEFANDGTGGATLHQWGKTFPLTRVDAGAAAHVQNALEARIANNVASAGSEAALRHYLDRAAASNIDYDQLEPMLADAVRQQATQIKALNDQLGAVQSIRFVGVGNAGWDVYDVKFAKGSLQYRIVLADNGKIAGLMGMSVP